jgi:hypothetical protein
MSAFATSPARAIYLRAAHLRQRLSAFGNGRPTCDNPHYQFRSKRERSQ